MKRRLVRLAFASGVWARTSDLRRLFRCLTLGATVLARRCHARTERVCTLLCFLRSHFFPSNFGSRADDPSPKASLQKRVLLYKKEHLANRDSHSRSYRLAIRWLTLPGWRFSAGRLWRNSVAPRGCDSSRWGIFRSLGVGLLTLWRLQAWPEPLRRNAGT